MRAELNVMRNGVLNFVSTNAGRIRQHLGGETAQWAREAISLANNFENMATNVQMVTTDFTGL